MKLYTGNEALEIVDKARDWLEDDTRLDPLGSEFPTFSRRMHALGAGAISLLRTDLNRAGTFKCRGAFVGASAIEDGLLAVSAGNHSQGVALAARYNDTHANIVIPSSAPLVKQEAPRRLGGDHVTVHIQGRTFDEALEWALSHPELGIMLHPFDNGNVIAGQGTTADDLTRLTKTIPDHVTLTAGGGGLVAGFIRRLDELGNTHTQLHVFEPEGSNSLSQSLIAGEPTEVMSPNQHFGGSAVRKIGAKAFDIIWQYRDRITTYQVTDFAAAKFATEYRRDRHARQDTAPPIEPTSLPQVVGLEQVALRHPGETVTAIITGHNAPLEPLIQSQQN